jgi:hypothetical protein
MMKFLSAMVVSIALVSISDAGPFGIFGGGKMSGGCGAGGCGGGGGMSAMSSGSSWGSSAPMMHSAPKSIEVGAARPLDFFVNIERARAGLAPVSVTNDLNVEAAKQAQNSAADGKLGRSGAWQNVARASSDVTPAELVKAWMGDPVSRDRILSADYKTCGFASARGVDGKTYWTLTMGK